MKKYTMEFLGTFFLVLSIGLSGDPYAVGLTLVGAIYAGGHISGAHYNPAVTIAMWMRGKTKISEIPGYMVAQVAGSFLAALFVYSLYEKSFAPMPGEKIVALQAISVEAILTFLLVFVILSVATSPKLEGNYIYGLAIGLTVTAIAISGGGISGGAFNPAVGIGPIIVDEINGGNSLSHLYIYIVGPFLGAIFSAVVYAFLNAEDL